jgi:uncharacterized protein (DUF849 family)
MLRFSRAGVMRKSNKVIITCAVTGSIHTPTMSPHLPFRPADIARQAIDAAQAGAAVLHLHARDPVDGRPTPDPEVFMQFLPAIKAGCAAVVNISTGGGIGMTLEQRLAASHRARPELVSLNMGSMNFAAFELARKYNEWRFAWEKPYLEGTFDGIYPNTFRMIDRIIRDVGHAYGTRFEFECYDVGHLYTVRYFVDKGLLRPPYLIQCVLGVMGGIGLDPENLTHMKVIADKLFGDDYYLSVLAIGREQQKYLTMSAAMGGNVRVGLEDSLFLTRGQLAESNAAQVSKIRRIVEELGLEIATPDDARQMLELKGPADVGF